MKKLFVAMVTLSLWIGAHAQQNFTLKIYPDGPAESNGLTGPEGEDGGPGRLINVSEAEILVYLPAKAKATGQAVVVCPGGGYRMVSMLKEGYMVADWLNARGIAAILVKYRLPNGHYKIPMTDTQTALKITRDKAAEWGIDPARVGIMGFSAGGHLASTVATHFTSPEERPDFSILVYPVITADTTIAHRGSFKNLMGDSMTPELLEQFSNDKRVTPQTPPTFIVFCNDDKTVDARNGTLFYDACKANGVPAELHIYPVGGHGWGFTGRTKTAGEFYTSLERWLGEVNTLEKK